MQGTVHDFQQPHQCSPLMIDIMQAFFSPREADPGTQNRGKGEMQKGAELNPSSSALLCPRTQLSQGGRVDGKVAWEG